MGFTYEVAITGTIKAIPVANIFHVWDGDENETPDIIADVFEDDFLVNSIAQQSDTLTWSGIAVKALDVGNGLDPINRVINLVGVGTAELAGTGIHVWVKFNSDDNGFKSGGKLWPGLTETWVEDGVVTAAHLALIQNVFETLLTDLAAAGLSLAIYRPTLSLPGFPSISISSSIVARGFGTNNRRQEPFQL